MSDVLRTLTAADFEPQRGMNFMLTAPDRELALELIEVRRLGQAMRAGGAFSLLFATPPGAIMPQGIYPVAHPTLGRLELFVVPLGPRNGAIEYEVIFT